MVLGLVITNLGNSSLHFARDENQDCRMNVDGTSWKHASPPTEMEKHGSWKKMVLGLVITSLGNSSLTLARDENQDCRMNVDGASWKHAQPPAEVEKCGLILEKMVLGLVITSLGNSSLPSARDENQDCRMNIDGASWKHAPPPTEMEKNVESRRKMVLGLVIPSLGNSSLPFARDENQDCRMNVDGASWKLTQPPAEVEKNGLILENNGSGTRNHQFGKFTDAFCTA
jgi:uncharacterized protein YejL (UPF0352 family)